MTVLRRFYIDLVMLSYGAVVMGIEILGTRSLAPHFGSDLHVWAALISVTLVGLSVGCALGGLVADRFPRERVLHAILLLAGVLVLGVPFLAAPAVGLCLPLGLEWGALATAFLLLVLPLAVLAMVLPFAVRLEARRPEKIGFTAGRLYALSTLGSVLGTLGTAFVLVPSFGTKRILLFAACWLLALALLGALIDRGPKLHVLIMSLVAAGGAMALGASAFRPPSPGADAGLTFYKEGAYGELKVIDRGLQRYLLVNNVLQTAMNRSGLFLVRGSLLWSRNYAELLPYFDPRGRQGLLIGLGGGLIPRVMEQYGIRMESVDVDPDVIAVAREFFGFDGEAHALDGRWYLTRRSPGSYDFIVLDAFAAENVPFHLLTREMFALVRSRLRAEGILCLHHIGSPEDVVSRSIVKTLLSEFDHVRVYGGGAPGGLRSLYLFASSAPLVLENTDALRKHAGFTGDEELVVDPRGARMYTDDFGPVDVQNMANAEAWRRSVSW
jgi:spermidine synthase